MLKEIEKFIKKNQLKIKHTNSKYKVLIADRTTQDTSYSNSLAGFIFNQELHSNIEVLTDLKKNNILFNVYESFNIKNIKNISILNFSFKNIFIYIKTLLLLIISYFKLIFLGSDWFIKKFKVFDIYFGDIIYDTYIRNNFRFKNKNFFDLYFLKLLIITLYRIIIINKILKKNNYIASICSSHVGASISAIQMRLSLKNKVPVLSILSNNIKIYKDIKDTYQQYFKVKKNDLKNLIKKDKNWKKKIDIYLQNRFKGKIKQINAIDAFKKTNKSASFERLLKKNKKKYKYKKIGVFAPHAFSDANYSSGPFLFRSFYQQYIKTIKILKKSKDTLWIIKPHPSSEIYKEQGLIDNEIRNINCDNIILCPKKISTNYILKIADLLITGRGTIGIEYACIGKKPIIAGDSFYSNLGFTNQPKNFEKYKKEILHSENNKLTKKQIINAKKTLYFLAFKNSHIKSKVVPFTTFLEIDLKKKIINQYFDKESLKKGILGNLFYKKLVKNMSKKSILNDDFYISLKQIIKKQFNNEKNIF